MIKEIFVEKLLNNGKFPFGIGGEHLVTWGIVPAVITEKYPNMKFNSYGCAYRFARSSLKARAFASTPIRKICELIGPENVYSFGVRSGEERRISICARIGNAFLSV